LTGVGVRGKTLLVLAGLLGAGLLDIAICRRT
jgi:hypothetical protein